MAQKLHTDRVQGIRMDLVRRRPAPRTLLSRIMPSDHVFSPRQLPLLVRLLLPAAAAQPAPAQHRGRGARLRRHQQPRLPALPAQHRPALLVAPGARPARRPPPAPPGPERARQRRRLRRARVRAVRAAGQHVCRPAAGVPAAQEPEHEHALRAAVRGVRRGARGRGGAGAGLGRRHGADVGVDRRGTGPLPAFSRTT